VIGIWLLRQDLLRRNELTTSYDKFDLPFARSRFVTPEYPHLGSFVAQCREQALAASLSFLNLFHVDDVRAFKPDAFRWRIKTLKAAKLSYRLEASGADFDSYS
jgi:hypothetical protein